MRSLGEVTVLMKAQPGGIVQRIPRTLGVLVAILFFASGPQQATAANVAAGDGTQSCPGGTGSISATARGERPRAPANPGVERALDAIRVLPGVNMPFVDLPEVSSSIATYSEGSLTHTVRTTVRAGRIPTSREGTTGGHRPSLMSSACVPFQREVHKVSHMICGGGCLIQYLQRTVDRYSNPNNLHYWDRVEVRIWRERQYSTGLYFTGDAYTRWDEGYAFDCEDGSNQGRIVYSYTTPVWNTWDRTYDYYWTEYQLPTVTPTLAGPVLRVSTTTPESYGPNLYTQVDLQ